MDGPLPLYDEVVGRLLSDPRVPARHRLYGHDAITEEIPVGRHGDDDHDGVVNQVDPDWRWRPDARDEHAHGDDACDAEQVDADRWVGVTRDPDALEANAAAADA